MFSSNVIYTGDGFESTAFRCGAVYHPFRPPEDGQALESAERAPLLCLKCAGFLNKYCQVNEENGEWQCSLCTYINPSFLIQSTSEDLEAYAELHHSQVEFMERDLTPIYIPVGVTEHIHLFAIDTFVSGVEDIEGFLRFSFERLSENTRVCVVGFGKSINLLRLCGGGESDTAIIADTLPGTRDLSHTLGHFFQQGEYLTPACKALLIVRDIAGALKCMAVGSLDNKTVTTTTCSALVQVARGLGNVHGPGIKMLLITARTIPLGALPAHMSGSSDSGRGSGGGGGGGGMRESLSRIEGYAALGYDACIAGRCWIDVVVVGLHAVQLDLLDALSSSSGGAVVSGYSLREEVVLASVGHFLELPTSCFPPHATAMTERRADMQRLHTDGTIFFEVRTSRGVMPETVFGPVVMQHQEDSAANWINGIASEFTGSGSLSCSVDKLHVTNMVNITTASAGKGAEVAEHNAEVIYKELCNACNGSDYVASCALHRADPDFTLSFLLHPNEDIVHTDGAVVQLVLRWNAVANSKSGGRESCLMTRILTYKLRSTTDKREFLASVDVDLWSSMASRAIAGDLHAASDGLGLSKTSKEEKKDPMAALLSSDDGE
jgi:hypothetical protein